VVNNKAIPARSLRTSANYGCSGKHSTKCRLHVRRLLQTHGI